MVANCATPLDHQDLLNGFVVGRSTARRDDLAWLNNHARPLPPAALDHLARRWFARAGVPLPRGAAAHAFRHTVAMQLVGRGAAVNVVQALLGTGP